MILISTIHILIYFYLGIIVGYTKNPYNHEIIDIFKNIILDILPIVAIELTRGLLITRNKNNKLLIVMITLILILSEVKYNVLINLYYCKKDLFEYICQSIIPLISYSILYTYLTLEYSYTLTLLFRIFLKFFYLLSPVLTNMDWFITGSTSVISSTIIYLLFKYKFNKKSNVKINNKLTIYSSNISYIVTIVLCIFLICFMIGVFAYEPITILSNSMVPTLNRADIVIYKKLKESELKEIPNNSIIIYKIGNQNVAHRIVNIIKDDNIIKYQTKGDSNNVADNNLVEINQIKGVYVFHIKYIGYPSVWLYEFFNNEETKVEIGGNNNEI